MFVLSAGLVLMEFYHEAGSSHLEENMVMLAGDLNKRCQGGRYGIQLLRVHVSCEGNGSSWQKCLVTVNTLRTITWSQPSMAYLTTPRFQLYVGGENGGSKSRADFNLKLEVL